MSTITKYIPGVGNKNNNDESGVSEQQAVRLHQAHEQARQSPQPMSPDFINEMTNHQLDPGTVDILSNMLSKDFVLGNFNDAEVNEFKWLLRLRIKKVTAVHPPKRSHITGKRRQFLVDDEEDRQGLEPLDDPQYTVLDSLIDGIVARMTRGRSGWQQEMFGKTISESIVRDANQQESGGWFGRGAS